MSYPMSFPFYTGTAGQLATLSAQYYNTASVAVGSPITTGFSVLPGGLSYQFYDPAVTSGFRGVLQIFVGGVPSVLPFSINPQELENADVLTSSVSGNGGGSHAVTITVQTSGAVPVPNAQVTVKNSAQSAIIAYGLTDTLGQVSFALNSATYKVLVSAGVGYQALAVQTLVVSGTSSATYTLTAQSVTPPADLDYCRLYGTLSLPTGAVASNVPVRVRLSDEGAVVSSGRLISVVYDMSATTDGDGYFEIDLLRSDSLTPNTSYLITCAPCRVNLLASLASSTVDISTLV